MAQQLVDGACGAVRARGGVDANQVVAYDVAHAAAAVATARAALGYGALGETEARLARAFVADVVADLVGRVAGREAAWGVEAGLDALRPRRSWPTTAIPAFLAALGHGARATGTWTTTSSWCARPSTASPRSRSGPTPSTSTGPTATSPRRSSRGWPSWGASGCRSPRSTAASPPAARATTWAWWWPPRSCRWGSLGVGGSLITRPEILTRALVYGGTEEQKKQWLPKLASAEVLAAVAVTEPDFGSDVAGIVTSATPRRGGLVDQRGEDLVHLRRPGRRA